MALTSTLLNRLAAADWNARQAGSPQITAQQIATAATNLANAKLATMTASQQSALFEQCMSILTAKGRFALNSYTPYVTATQQSDGRWTVTISPDAFSARKTYFRQTVPGMMSSSDNFYPGEAIVVLYSVASDDMGFGGTFQQSSRKAIADLTGIDMTNNYLYGPNGYLARRPLSTFFTEQSMSQFFSALGF